MKIVCYRSLEREAVNGGPPRYGALLEGGKILDFEAAAHDITRSHKTLPPPAALGWLDLAQEWLALVENVLNELRCEPRSSIGGQKWRLLDRDRVELLAPVPRPGKVICIGLNYRDHAEESNMPIPERPIVFSKFTTSVIGPGRAIRLPASSSQVDFEAELAVVIGRVAKGVDEKIAMDYVLGYTNFNDVSARDFQFADGQWQRGKSCDSFAPTGEFIALKDEISDPHALRIQLHLNGTTMQDSSTAQLIFNVPQLVAFISDTITLEPGDIIATGTPPGVGFARKPPVFLKAGDRVEVEVEGLGRLSNPVEDET